MNLELQQSKSMKELLSKEEFFLPKPGSILNGQVISVSKGGIFVDLGSIGIGIIYPGEFYDNPDRMRTLKPGDQASVMLLELENNDGYREISLRAAQMTTAWQDIKEKKDKGETIITIINNINKGGLIVEVSGIQGFLPLSQLSSEHYPKVDGGDTTKIVQALQKFKGLEFKVKIIDFSEAENKLIVSEKAIKEEAVKEELAKLKLEDIITGQISEVTDFGAFVKLSETMDGLIHSSEIDWKFIENPREVLKPGQEVQVKIISLDGGRVSLSLKALKNDPWLKVDEKYQVGQKVKAKTVKIRSNGVFLELAGDIIGFLPVAELGGQNPSELFELNKEYELAVLNIDSKEHKLIFTLPGKSAGENKTDETTQK